MEGFFELKTAADLREKLRRDLAKVEAAPLDVDALFNFLVTAEHLPDWIHPGRAGREAREAVKDGSVLLRVCSHVANGGKHFRVEAKRHGSVAQVRKTDTSIKPHIMGMHALGTMPLGYFVEPARLLIDLQGEAAAQLGISIEGIDLARRIMAFWDAHPLT